MARDYKDRGTYAKKRNAEKHDKKGRWILIGLLIAGFAGFLSYLRLTKPVDKVTMETSTSAKTPPVKTAPQKPSQAEKPASKGPKFDFYEILPQAEVIVPEHEIKTRLREELTGKTRSANYILQAGSFEDFKDADKLKADLALMGIASKIEKAKVGDVIWHRVKLGPYAQAASIETIKTQLKKRGIDVIITEISKPKTN